MASTRLLETVIGGNTVATTAMPKRPAPLPAVVPDEVEAGRAAGRILLDAGHRAGIEDPQV